MIKRNMVHVRLKGGHDRRRTLIDQGIKPSLTNPAKDGFFFYNSRPIAALSSAVLVSGSYIASIAKSLSVPYSMSASASPANLFWKKTQRRIPKKDMDIVPMIAVSFKALAPIRLLVMMLGKTLPSSHISASFISVVPPASTAKR